MAHPGETYADQELLARILELAGTEMVREFLGDIAAQETGRAEKAQRPVTLRHVRRIETLALSDGGRKVARRYNVHVADAIDPTPLLHLKSFATKKLPQLLKLMSTERQVQIGLAQD